MKELYVVNCCRTAVGSFGGSLKNIAIGCASGQMGKKQVHGVVGVENVDWQKAPMKEYFMELLADSGKATCDYFGKHIVFLNRLTYLYRPRNNCSFGYTLAQLRHFYFES